MWASSKTWNSTEYKNILPSISPKFETTIVSLRQENLLAENLLSVVVPPIDCSHNFQDENHNEWFSAKLVHILEANSEMDSANGNKKKNK